MALFNNPFDEPTEDKIMPEGEYNLKVTSVNTKTADTGREYLLVTFANIDEPDAETIFHRVNGLMPDDEPQTRKVLSNMAHEFFAYFGLDPNSGGSAELIGRDCAALVVQTEWQGRIRNEIKKFI
jgi:hypothetical protein